MTALGVEKLILRIAGLLGLAVFGFLFALTYSVPHWVEEFASDYIAERVAERVDETFDRSRRTADGALAHLAADLHEKNEKEMVALRERAQELLSLALAEVRNPECACRLLQAHELTLGQLGALSAGNERLKGFIHGAYMNVLSDLEREIRIFTTINAACFLLLIVVSLAKPGAVQHLIVPGALLLGATLFCAYLYVFEQNWLLTIIEGSYVGFAYAAYLSVVFLFLCDIALNRGRVTTRIVNGALDAVGSAFSLAPC
jgi:hypothetical protein